MATGDQKDWYFALKRGAEFSSDTDLKLVEVLRYPGFEEPRWSERSLNDTSLKALFKKVKLFNIEMDCINLSSGISLVLVDFLDRLGNLQVDYGYCKCSPCEDIAFSGLLTTIICLALPIVTGPQNET
jgi:hypothetical protein